MKSTGSVQSAKMKESLIAGKRRNGITGKKRNKIAGLSSSYYKLKFHDQRGAKTDCIDRRNDLGRI